MRAQYPQKTPLLLAIIIVLLFVFVKNFDSRDRMPDMGLSAKIEINTKDIVAFVKPSLAYLIVPFDEYTGRVAATPFIAEYRDYDTCLVALFEKRANMALVKTQYKMSVKCDRLES